MEKQVTRTKIVPPRQRVDLYSRPRLLALFDELIDFKLVLMVAPAGYGKTTLLIDFAHASKQPICWYSIDILDRDPQRFFAHFIAAVTHRFPSFGAAAWAALQGLSQEQETFDQFVITIINELYEHVTEHFVFILDDYHLVNDTSSINEFISRLVQQAPETCHLVLASRQLIGLPNLALLVARGYVGGLDYEELAFTADEIQHFIARTFKHTISSSEAQKLAEATAGWVTGLLLSAESKITNIAGRMRRLRIAGVDLYDYLAQQVLDQQQPIIRDFLLHSSVLEEFDTNLCEAILGHDWLPPQENWHNLIDQILRRNLFVLPVGAEGTWVRYHPLFLEFLQKRFAQEYPTKEIFLYEQLANYYVQQEEWEKAHRLYLRHGNFAAIAGLIEQSGLNLLQIGRIGLLAKWLTDLPAPFFTTYPNLLWLKGEVLSRQGEVQQGLALFGQAENELSAAGDRTGLAQTLVHRSVAQRLLGNYPAALADGERVLGLIAEHIETESRLLSVKALALRATGLTLYVTGRLSESIVFLQQSLDIYQNLDSQTDVATVSSEIAMVCTGLGRHEQALPLYHRSLEVWRKAANISAQSVVLNNLGVAYHLQGNYLQALQYIEEAYSCAQHSGYTRFVCNTLIGMADIFADLELGELAQKLYFQAFMIAQRIGERFLLLYLQLAIAKVASSTADWATAFEHLNAASHIVLDQKSSYEWGLYQLAMGRYYLAQAKTTIAVDVLCDACDRFNSDGQPIERATAHFFLAAAYAAAGEKTFVLAQLKQGLQVAVTLENQHALVVALRPLKPFLRTVQSWSGVKEPVVALLKAIETFEHSLPDLNRRASTLLPQSLLLLLNDAPPKLTLHALGRTEVLMEGRAITNNEWQTQISRDILFCLLAHPDGLTKDEIGELFWPDATISEVKTRFKNAIYRLRNALSQQVVLFSAELYRFNWSLAYEYDVEQFLQKAEQGDSALLSIERIAAYQEALQLYRGDYLLDVDTAWVLVERERLHRIFIDTTLTLGQLQLEAHEYRSALETCQRALTDDPCLEDAHRLAMRIYAAMGNRAAVARQFAQCRQALLDEIDAPPSPQTEELYTLLMRS